MKLTSRQKAARKAARTRAANRAMLKRWREVDEPANRRVEGLFNKLLKITGPVRVRWDPPAWGAGRKLKNGAQYGTLVKVLHGGRAWSVRPEGYQRPQDFSPIDWEVLL